MNPGNDGNMLYNHYDAPNNSTWDCINLQQQKTLAAAQSLHSGGVALLLWDGSVRFASNSTDLPVWRSLGTRQGSEVVEGW